MTIWSTEIKELEVLYSSFKGRYTDLENELERLIHASDENMVLVYARRCLEVIVNDLCESELKRLRKTEPLQGIIDKLNREEMVPANIIVSMQSLNSLSTFGAHPKDFDPEQVKPVLNNLTTIIKWYTKFKTQKFEIVDKKKQEELVNKKTNVKIEPQLLVKLKNKPFIIISGVLIIGIVLIFALDLFHIFPKDRNVKITGADNKISIAVMPFDNLTNNVDLDIWESGIQFKLNSELQSYPELSVLNEEIVVPALQNFIKPQEVTLSPAIARKTGLKMKADIIVIGKILSSEDKIHIESQIIETKSGKIIGSESTEGKGQETLLNMCEDLAIKIKNDLKIMSFQKNISGQVEESQLMNTSSSEAYHYYVLGQNSYLKSDFESATDNFRKALEIDSNFIGAKVQLFMTFYCTGEMNEVMKIYRKLLPDLNKIPNRIKVEIERLNYTYIEKRPKYAAEFLKQSIELDPQYFYFWYGLGDCYRAQHNYNQQIEAYETASKLRKQSIGPFTWTLYYTELGWAYHEVGNHKKESNLYKKALKINPNDHYIVRQQAICALSLGKSVKANEYLDHYITIRKNEETWSESGIFSSIADIYNVANIPDKAEEFYRQALASKPQDPFKKYDLADFLVHHNIKTIEGIEIIDSLYKIYPDNWEIQYTKGFTLFKEGKYDEALDLLKKSWDERPYYDQDHYLLLQETEKAITNQNK
jgi:tetratricopeptide (TPR) repeat protein